MGRELQKKKNRSSTNKVTRRKQNLRKKPNITGNKLVAAEWDKNETLAQNYKRLGLTHRLKKSTGGKEIHPSNTGSGSTTTSMGRAIAPNEARIIRGADGNIVSIKYADDLRYETLGGEDDDEGQTIPTRDGENDTDLVKALRDQTTMGIKKERLQSEREVDWIQSLVDKHGDDYQAMFWDKQLNIMQQSVGDIKRRVKKWKASQKA